MLTQVSNKTFFPKPDDIKREWSLIDAKGVVFGRLVVAIAKILSGKTRPYYTPNTDCGDFVVVTNALQIKVTGKKLVQKYKFHHTGYPGGGREIQFGKLMSTNPEKAIFLAVKGMLPKTKLGDKFLTRLRVYKDANHKHSAQKLNEISIKG
ncbi:MAG: 50S ribosomal protein L13 [bacterium]